MILFTDKAFAAPNLPSPEQLTKFNVEEGRNQLRLPPLLLGPDVLTLN